jgi:hypothetical protein
MTQQQYVKKNLNWFDKLLGAFFVIPAVVLFLGITWAMMAGLEEVPSAIVIIFLMMFPLSVMSHVMVTRKIARLRDEWISMTYDEVHGNTDGYGHI